MKITTSSSQLVVDNNVHFKTKCNSVISGEISVSWERVGELTHTFRIQDQHLLPFSTSLFFFFAQKWKTAPGSVERATTCATYRGERWFRKSRMRKSRQAGMGWHADTGMWGYWIRFQCIWMQPDHRCILDPVNLYHHQQKAPQTVNTARPTTLPIGRNTVLSKAYHKPAWNVCPPENVNGWSDGREMRRRGGEWRSWTKGYEGGLWDTLKGQRVKR